MNSDKADRSADELRAHDARISELESRLEFQDETIQKLNDENCAGQHPPPVGPTSEVAYHPT